MWIERNSTLRGMSAVGLAFLLNSCGGDTQVIQVLPAMSAEVGGAGAVSGSSGGSGGRASNLVGAVSGGSGGSVATIGSGGAVKTSGGAVGIGTGGMASGGSGVPGGSGGAAAGGAVGVGGMSGQTGGVSSGGSGAGGAPPMTEALCKLGMPGTEGTCLIFDGSEFAWGGHCYGILGGAFSWDNANLRCAAAGAGWSLASLNCAQELAYVSQRVQQVIFDGETTVAIGGLHEDLPSITPTTPLTGWQWVNGDPWEYAPPFASSSYGGGPYNSLHLVRSAAGAWAQVDPGNRTYEAAQGTSYICEGPGQ